MNLKRKIGLLICCMAVMGMFSFVEDGISCFPSVLYY